MPRRNSGLKKFHVGAYVRQTNDGRIYIGHITDVNPSDPTRIYVRWHAGYASWTDASTLQITRRPNP